MVNHPIFSPFGNYNEQNQRSFPTMNENDGLFPNFPPSTNNIGDDHLFTDITDHYQFNITYSEDQNIFSLNIINENEISDKVEETKSTDYTENPQAKDNENLVEYVNN